jgi:hypothetical protein
MGPKNSKFDAPKVGPPSTPPDDAFFLTSDKEILWKQYELQIDLYKKYMELILQFNVFYYAATGALISYYFSKSDIDVMKYALLLPVLMSFGFAGLFFYGARAQSVSRDEIFNLRDALGLESAPETRVLQVLLCISASLMIVVGTVILVFFCSALRGTT